MRGVIISIRAEHNANIEALLKTSELRTLPPKLKPPFKVYTYESGPLGRHKIVNEWICKDMVTWRMCMGIPAHLSKVACVSNDYIRQYSGDSYKDVTEMKISDLVIYDTPKELSEFARPNKCPYNNRGNCTYDYHCFRAGQTERCGDYVEKPPQNWCYVEVPNV